MSSVAAQLLKRVADYIEDCIIRAVASILSLSEKPRHHFLIFTPLEEGGLGYLPVSELISLLRLSATNGTIDILESLEADAICSLFVYLQREDVSISRVFCGGSI